MSQEKSQFYNAEKHLPLEDAQKEANIIKGTLAKGQEEEPWNPEHRFSAENYQKVLDHLEELKAELSQEKEIVQNLYKVGRFVHNASKIIGVPVQFMSDMVAGFTHSTPDPTGMKELEREGHDGFVARFIRELSDYVKEELADPAKRMKELEKIGEDYEKTTRE